MHTVTVAYGRRSLESNFDVELAEGSRDTPGVGLLVFVVERLDLLRLLGSTQARWVGELEELWRKLDEPFRIDRRHFTHVFLGRHHQLMVNHPVTDDRTATSGDIQQGTFVLNSSLHFDTKTAPPKPNT